MKRKIKLLDLFSGIGGFSLGLRNAGFEFEEHYFSEIDKYAIANYKYHFKNAKYVGDVKTIQPADIGAIDIVAGGFPCQSFSIAGKRQGFEDTRGTLFFEVVRLCKDLQPKYILLENVKGLLNHDGGRTYAVIYQSLVDIGYSVEFQLVNTRWFLPQNRERIYLVGHLASAGRSTAEVFPIGEDDSIYCKKKPKHQEQFQAQHSTTITASGNIRGYETFVEGGTWRTHKDGEGFRPVRSGVCPTIPARAREDGSGQPIIRQLPRGNNKGNDFEICPTISASHFDRNNFVGGLRRLTPIECERLQGFPDNWTRYGVFDGKTKEISDAQRYKMIGNAVTVRVVEEIGKRLIK